VELDRLIALICARVEGENMLIREASVDDALTILNLHKRSVLALCRNEYSPAQLNGWLEHSALEKYRLRLQSHRTFVAERDGEVVGYVRWNPATNELCSIFIDPDHVRQGVATELMQIVYHDAIDSGVTELWLDASLTAVPFYQVEGWTYVERMMHGPLESFRMTKELLSGGGQ
jgi:putative acetyltransferase